MTPQEQAQLLRELADQLEHDRRCLMDDRNWIVPLADRARIAAEEIEGRAMSPEPISLERIALVSHGGGLIGFADPHKALTEIRKLSHPWLGNQVDDLQRKQASSSGEVQP